MFFFDETKVLAYDTFMGGFRQTDPNAGFLGEKEVFLKMASTKNVGKVLNLADVSASVNEIHLIQLLPREVFEYPNVFVEVLFGNFVFRGGFGRNLDNA